MKQLDTFSIANVSGGNPALVALAFFVADAVADAVRGFNEGRTTCVQ